MKRILFALLIWLCITAGCDTLYNHSTNEPGLIETSQALPETGPTPIPLLAETDVPASTAGATSSGGEPANAERNRANRVLERFQRLSGRRYVAFTSRQTPNGTYRYRYRVLNVPDELEASAKGRTSYYTYVRKSAGEGHVARFIKAVIPDSPEARAKMNRWAEARTGRGRPASSASGRPSDKSPAAVRLLKVDDCDYSEQIVYHPECSCFGYEYVEICDSAGGGGDGGGEEDDWYDDPSDCDDPFGCDEGGGDGGDGGGGDDEDAGCDPDEITCQELDELQYISKGDATAKYIQVCQEFDGELHDKFFEADVRKALGMTKIVNPIYPTQPLDGVKYGVLINGNWDYSIIDKVMEAKFSSESGSFSFDQSEHHIDLLYENYQEFVARTDWQLFAPSYWAVSLSPDVNRLDFNNLIVPYANERHVIVYHVRLFQNINDGNYYLKGEILGNTWGAPRLTSSIPFVFGCSPV